MIKRLDSLWTKVSIFKRVSLSVIHFLPFDSYDIKGLSLEFGNKTVNNFKVAMMEDDNSLFIHEIREKS